MGLLVEWYAAVGVDDRRSRGGLFVETLDLGRHIEVALGAQEVAVTRAFGRPHETERGMEAGMRVACPKGKVPTPPFRVQPHPNGHRLEQRRLAAAILADEKRDIRMKLQMFPCAEPHRG